MTSQGTHGNSLIASLMIFFGFRHPGKFCSSTLLNSFRHLNGSGDMSRGFVTAETFDANSLFVGSDGGAETWAILGSLLTTAKLNGLRPYIRSAFR